MALGNGNGMLNIGGRKFPYSTESVELAKAGGVSLFDKVKKLMPFQNKQAESVANEALSPVARTEDGRPVDIDALSNFSPEENLTAEEWRTALGDEGDKDIELAMMDSGIDLTIPDEVHGIELGDVPKYSQPGDYGFEPFGQDDPGLGHSIVQDQVDLREMPKSSPIPDDVLKKISYKPEDLN